MACTTVEPAEWVDNVGMGVSCAPYVDIAEPRYTPEKVSVARVVTIITSALVPVASHTTMRKGPLVVEGKFAPAPEATTILVGFVELSSDPVHVLEPRLLYCSLVVMGMVSSLS